MRLRVRFEKRGAVRFASHKDTVRIFQRCLAAADVPVSYSEGYHPHMRMSFGPPIKTGWKGLDEYMDLHMEGYCEALAERVNALLPDGLRVLGCAKLGDATPKLTNDICAAGYEILLRKGDLGDEHRSLSPAEEAIKTQTKGAEGDHEPLPGLIDVSVEDAGDDLSVRYTSTMLSGRVIKPQDVVNAAFGDPEALRMPIRVTREVQYVRRNLQYLSPLDEKVIQGTI